MSATLKKSLTNLSPQDGTGQAEEFRKLALRYVEIGAQEGIRIIPFLSPEMPMFQKASFEERQKATELLRLIISIHEETIAGGEKAIETKRLIWRALRKLSLIPGPDFFEKIGNEEVLVIYNENHLAIFWNLQFFKYSSFSVEQMFFCAWPEFTIRKPEIQQKIYELAVGTISGKLSGTFIPDVPGHEVQEVGSVECIRTWMELPLVSVLTKNGSFGGILAVKRMRILT